MPFQKLFSTLLAVTTLFIPLQLRAEIIEISHFEALKAHIQEKGTLCLVDIDDTCLIPCQTLGTDVWFLDRWSHYEKTGLSKKEALEKALGEWEAIRHLTQVKIVEEGTSQIIKDLQKQGVVMMGLTTQGLALATRTQLQLASLEIDLSQTAPYATQDYYFTNGHGVLYRHGILFTSGTPKGPALEKLLNLMQLRPSKIVFINDKKTHLQDIERSLEKMGIPFVGLRYGYSDKRTESYNPEIAKIQFEQSSFAHILSDQEAETLLSR
jgi:hypothetical protein